MRTDSEIFIARAEHSTASAAVLDLHACAGVATDAVPAPATRSGVAGAATPAPPAVLGSQGPLGPLPAPGDVRDRSGRGRRARTPLAPGSPGPLGPQPAPGTPRPRPRREEEEGGAGVEGEGGGQRIGPRRRFAMARLTGLRRRGTMVWPLLEAGFL